MIKNDTAADRAVLKAEFCCIGITETCILRCKMCHKWQEDIQIGTPKAQDFPTVEQYKNFILGLKEIIDEKSVLNFAGGEALIDKNLLELVSFSVKSGFHANIASNGWLIDEDMAKRIADSGLQEINISLDSIQEATHDYLRGVSGVYRRAMSSIEYLSKHCKGIKIGICSVIYDINLDGILPLVEWANSNSALSWVSFMAPMQPNNTLLEKEWWKGKYSFLWPKDTRKASGVVDDLIRLKGKGYKIGNRAVQLEAFKRYFNNPDKPARFNSCSLDKAVIISSLGDILLCLEQQGILGNIKNEDVRKLWYASDANKKRDNMKSCKTNFHLAINCFYRDVISSDAANPF